MRHVKVDGKTWKVQTVMVKRSKGPSKLVLPADEEFIKWLKKTFKWN